MYYWLAEKLNLCSPIINKSTRLYIENISTYLLSKKLPINNPSLTPNDPTLFTIKGLKHKGLRKKLLKTLFRQLQLIKIIS